MICLDSYKSQESERNQVILYIETRIMDRSADLLQAVHVGGAGAARTLKVIGDALQVCKGEKGSLPEN